MKMLLWLICVTSLLLPSLTYSVNPWWLPKPTPGEVTLLDGTGPCTGMLWKERDGEWAPKMDRWPVWMKDAHAACRQLGCGYAVSVEHPWGDQWRLTCSESLRLVNGTGFCSGRVEVKSNQSWVSVCEGDFDQQDAEVVCRQLGCGTHVILLGALYGEANVPMWTNEFQCEGNESALLDCRTSNSTRNTCSPDKAVGLTCSGVRLVHPFIIAGREPDIKCIGNMQGKPNGDWVRVYPSVELMETHQVCKQLDCGSATSTGTSDFFGFWFSKTYSEVEVICGDVRLVGGASNCTGTLEKKLDGEWIHVHGSYEHFKLDQAHEVCRLLDCGTAVDEDSDSTKVEVICSESVRLVNGTSWCSGRVEVKSNQSWVSVCEGDFDQQDAEVVCRQLGCGIPVVLQGALYGEANVPMWTNEFQCEGSEFALPNCRTSNSTRNTCSPDKAVGLSCSDLKLVKHDGESNCVGGLEERYDRGWRRTDVGRYGNLMKENELCRQMGCGGSGVLGIFFQKPRRGYILYEFICSDQVRLVGGTSHCRGTLERKDDQEWIAVQDQEGYFKIESAHAVCRQLDCGTAVSTKIIEIRGRFSWDPVYFNVEVICSESVRLVNGSSEWSGRVEVKSNQSWVSVCEDDFDQQDAEVVCRQLGGGSHAVLLGARYGEVNVPMWTKEFQCEGSESVLSDCRTSDSTRNTCSPDKAVGLTCSTARLVGGTSDCDGVLELEFENKEWRPVFDHYRTWDRTESHMVCRQLECGRALKSRKKSVSTRKVWHVTSGCKGSESSVKDCVGVNYHYGGHYAGDIWEITCSGPPVQPTPNTSV